MADPVPYKRAMAMGCDRVVLLLTRPADYRRPALEHQEVMEKALRRWPNSYAALKRRAVRYNRDVAAVKELEGEGKALLVAPESIGNMSTLTRDREAIQRLYDLGYEAGERVLSFARQGS